MCDDHHCRSAVRRVGEMAPRANEVLGALRDRGALIIHASRGSTGRQRDGLRLALAKLATLAEAR
jgi:hypothetical protein